VSSEHILVDARVKRLHGVPRRHVLVIGGRGAIVCLYGWRDISSEPAADVAADVRVSSGQVFRRVVSEQNDELRVVRRR